MVSGDQNHIPVGLAVGEGTGPELASVFRTAVGEIGKVHNRTIDLIECPHRFRTFVAIGSTETPSADVIRMMHEDCDAYEAFIRRLPKRGVRALFRTAINAESLYLARERLAAVKIEHLPWAGGEIFLVRDEAQGFYGGCNSEDSDSVIRRECEFRRDWTERLLDYARAEAAAHFGSPDAIDHVLLAYKFHLLDNRFASWVEAYGRRHGLRLRLFQPDTMNRHLLRGTFRGNVLIVGGNEWVDVMHAELLARFGLGLQENRHTRNVYLAEGVAGIIEYQTVHGSADDIAGRGIVNPTATLRAAAHLLEQHAGCEDAFARMERAINAALHDGAATPDLGGQATTDSSTRLILNRYLADFRTGATHHTSDQHSHTALVIVDMQNDLCADGGLFHKRQLVNPAETGQLAQRVSELIELARNRGLPVVFTQMHAREETLPATVNQRNRHTGRSGYLEPGSWGADFFGVQPAADELIFEKSGYDVFLEDGFQAYLFARGIRHLLIAGAFADVCVDALARTAYQKGYEVTIVSDATLALTRPLEDALQFMEQFYGARVRPMRALGPEILKEAV